MSFYVTVAAGKFRLGIYDATGPGGGPGVLDAQTNEIAPVVGWNTANVITPVALAPGTYWLTYLPSDNNLAFVKTSDNTSSGRYYAFPYGALPATFSTTPSSTASHWSFYGTLSTGPQVVAVTIAPISVTLPTNGAQQFTATVSGSSNTSVTWSATGGSISVSGFYTAGAVAGTYTVTATSQADTTKSATATVTVTNSTGSTTPTLVQWTEYPNDLSGAGPQGIVKCLANPTQAGNAVVVFVVTNDNPVSYITVTDDTGNSYTMVSSEFDGSRLVAAYVALNVTPGARCISVTLGTGGNDNQVAAAEFQNVATASAIDGTPCAATLTSGTALTCGSMTTGTSGDLVIEAGYVVSFSTTPTDHMTWTAQTGGAWNLLVADGTSFFGVQYEVQGSAGAVNPAITVSSAVTRANVVGFALKSASSGAGPPAGIYVKGMQVWNTPESANVGTTSVVIQFPCSGNELALSWQDGVNTGNNPTGITDTNSNTWVSSTKEVSANNDAAVQWWHADNATCSNTETITVTLGNNNSNSAYGLYDILHAGGFDATFGSSGGGAANATATTNLHSGTFTGPTGTPSTANGVVLGVFNLGQDTTVAVSPGYFMPPCLASTTTLGCNQPVYGEGTYADQDGGHSIYYNPSTARVTTSWTVYDSMGIAMNEWWASSIAIKGQ